MQTTLPTSDLSSRPSSLPAPLAIHSPTVVARRRARADARMRRRSLGRAYARSALQVSLAALAGILVGLLAARMI